ncbi:MAG: hypothetical protein RL386_888 [Bacteroidota bacterium]
MPRPVKVAFFDKTGNYCDGECISLIYWVPSINQVQRFHPSVYTAKKSSHLLVSFRRALGKQNFS